MRWVQQFSDKSKKSTSPVRQPAPVSPILCEIKISFLPFFLPLLPITNTNFKLNTEAHDENNSHLNNIHSCLSECDYYTDLELNAMHVTSTSCISTLSINCRSISKKNANIECSLKSLDNHFDCVGLTETWLKTNDNTDMFNLPDYTLMSRPRVDKRGGGVGLYITDKTSFKVRDDLVMNPVTCQYESLFIETVMHDHKVIIGVIYKPP